MIDPTSIPVRFSRLKNMAQSPAHYFHAVQHDREDTMALRLGRGVHAQTTGSQRVVCYEGRRDDRIKAWQAFQEENADAEILSPAEYAEATAMSSAILRHPVMGPLVDPTLPDMEVEKEYRFHVGERLCSMRLDFLRWRGGNPWRMIELKTARTAHPERFLRDALKMHYDGQVAWYVDGIERCYGVEVEAYIGVVEKDPPHACTVFRVQDSALESGRRKYRLWFERLMVCEQSGHWPEYASDALPFEVIDEEAVL